MNCVSKSDASGTTSFTFNEENQLTQVALPSGLTVNYKYDALGRRIQRTTSAGANERYVYDGADTLIDLNADWSVATTYLNDLGIDNHLRQTSSTTGVSYFLTDHLGSTSALADVSGNVVEQLAYDSFGNSAGSSRTRYGYTGRERDPDMAMLYYRSRFYDPSTGRFSTEDPLGFGGGQINLYDYVANDPIRYVDPFGEDIIIIENQATSGNPFGHTAVAITGRGLYSFGNAQGAGTDKQDLLRASVKWYLFRELKRRNTTIYIIKTTPEEDAIAADTLDLIAEYGTQLDAQGILNDNCSTRVNKALDAAGIAEGPIGPGIPGSAGTRAVNDPRYAGKIEIPRNSNVLLSDLLKLKQFEPTTPIARPGSPNGTPVEAMRMLRGRRPRKKTCRC